MKCTEKDDCSCYDCLAGICDVGVSETAGCSTAKDLDEIMTLVFDAERYLKNVTMGGTQYGMAAEKLREARMRYLAYRAKP